MPEQYTKSAPRSEAPRPKVTKMGYDGLCFISQKQRGPLDFSSSDDEVEGGVKIAGEVPAPKEELPQ